MTLTVTFTNFATGRHTYCVGDTWEAQDGPGRPWLETMVPAPTKDGGLGWFAVGGGLYRSQVEAIASIIEDATQHAATHAEALVAARQAEVR